MAMNREPFFCDGEGHLDRPRKILSRRQLLGAGLGAGVWWLGSKSALAQASFATKPTHDRLLVVVFLRGGADALNLVAPYGDDEYARARPTLSFAAPTNSKRPRGERALELDGFFGLNPALGGLAPAFAEGRLAIVHAVGSGDETRSHFEAMSTMERGLKSQTGPASSGWLARHLGGSPGSGSPLRAVSISRVMPDSLMGATHATAMQSVDELRLVSPELDPALAKLYSGSDDAVSAAGRETLQVLRALRKLDPTADRAKTGYPESPLGKALRDVAFLAKQDLGMEVACVESNGWDSHVAQGLASGWVWEFAKDLGDSLAAFEKDLGGEMSRVTVVVQSEFGRRVAENSGFGTDHGRGGAMLLLGGGVRGGKVFAKWPGLEASRLDGAGDLAVTTDYRDVLAEILAKRMGDERTQELFPGLRPSPPGIVAA